MTLRDDAARLLPELVTLRRELHRIPEPGFDLPQTQRAVLDALEGLGLEITSGTDLSSVTAVLRGAVDGPSVLLRGDMDALAIVEETGLDYAATNGAMHACGHDLHVAGLVGAARLLAARRDRIAGSVVFMFQPGEEAGGGAPLMIRDGVLEASGRRVEAAYGIHVGPGSADGSSSSRARSWPVRTC
ncbi:M20/M25/M40 family metallo-hydrolase [Microbacterium sp. Se5.02b]|uniref:M20 metallopeptidase family protein n=1 Tax=Microbacterium sp. Se5.02b TaxID=2864103 RepID=UPI002867F782|nr:M20/M25/M40 family metallo-hydrolase [Microbacterium sp. Se5.02b]